MTRIGLTAGAIAVVLSGSVGYAGGAEDAKAKAPPPPEPRVETVTETVTETVEVEVSPPECVRAIRLAREGFTLTVRFADIMVDFLEAASELDVATMAREQAKIPPLTEEVGELAPQFNANAEACEEAGA